MGVTGAAESVGGGLGEHKMNMCALVKDQLIRELLLLRQHDSLCGLLIILLFLNIINMNELTQLVKAVKVLLHVTRNI